MFFRIFCLLTITAWVQVQCYVPVPSIYQKVETALHHYSSHPEHNPVIFSLLNVLVYGKHAKAFITPEAIEISLKDVKKFHENDEEILREIIYGKTKPAKSNRLSSALEDNIQSALDTFFSQPNVGDYETFQLLSHKKKL
jgi:hypothetical protein